MPGGCQPLASKHTARHSQQHRPPWHPVQLKALLASGRVLLLCSHRRALGHMYVVVCFCLFFSCGIGTFGEISLWVWLSIWLRLMLLIAFWHFLCPYGTKASCWITRSLFLLLLPKPSAYTLYFSGLRLIVLVSNTLLFWMSNHNQYYFCIDYFSLFVFQLLPLTPNQAK